LDAATVNNERERRFTVSDGQQTYIVQATQTHRAQQHSAEPTLEWQFYIESLNLILVQDGKRYVSIDDPGRVFTAAANAEMRKPAASGLPPA
jgi:hypothetical protein